SQHLADLGQRDDAVIIVECAIPEGGAIDRVDAGEASDARGQVRVRRADPDGGGEDRLRQVLWRCGAAVRCAMAEGPLSLQERGDILLPSMPRRDKNNL